MSPDPCGRKKPSAPPCRTASPKSTANAATLRVGRSMEGPAPASGGVPPAGSGAGRVWQGVRPGMDRGTARPRQDFAGPSFAGARPGCVHRQTAGLAAQVRLSATACPNCASAPKSARDTAGSRRRPASPAPISSSSPMTVAALAGSLLPLTRDRKLPRTAKRHAQSSGSPREKARQTRQKSGRGRSAPPCASRSRSCATPRNSLRRFIRAAMWAAI